MKIFSASCSDPGSSEVMVLCISSVKAVESSSVQGMAAGLFEDLSLYAVGRFSGNIGEKNYQEPKLP